MVQSVRHTRFFVEELLRWYDAGHRRDLPWKADRNPYFIWLSEIILQQTRVEQGMPYFLHFRKTWPTLQHLAKATEDEVLKAWQGLGYYSRARRLLACAKYVQEQYGGVFPADYEALLELPGVGPYTAAAIASFAFDIPVPAIDGNAHRLFGRFFGIEAIPTSVAGKRAFRQMGEMLLPRHRPADFNQAVMDFASAVCRPSKPQCTDCPLQIHCWAYAANRVAEFPRRKPVRKKARRFMYYVILHLPKGKTCIRQRLARGIWQGLWEFPLIELPEPLSQPEELLQTQAWQDLSLPPPVRNLNCHPPVRHLLTHRELYIHFVEWEVKKLPKRTLAHFRVVNRKNLTNFAWPKPLAGLVENLVQT